ncbi:MMPL family transporter [Micromonosporaceae bacterium B7E4]
MWQRLVSLPAGRQSKWVVLATWLMIFGVFGWLAGFIEQVQDNDETNWMPANAQSTRAVHLANREFPADDTAALVIVYTRDGGLATADRAEVQHDRVELANLADGPLVGPEQSSDGKALMLTVPVAGSKLDSGEVNQVVADARAVINADLPAGLTAKATGPAASRADSAAANGQVDSTLTLATVIVVAVLLFVTYRSPVLLFVPLACVVFGVVVAQGATYLIGQAGATVSGSSFILMIVLVFGLGTDYALLLISRYREELRRHADRHEAMALALRRTVPSVLASAGTMVLAALALLAADMNSTKGLGPVAAVAVAAAVLAMTTLLPALLVVLGRGVFWPRIPRHTGFPAGAESAPSGAWASIAARVSRRPRRTWIVTTLVLAAMSGGVLLLNVGGLAGADNFTRKPDSVLGQEMIRAHFAAASTAPTLIYAPAGSGEQAVGASQSTAGVGGLQPAELSASGEWVRIAAVLADPPTTKAAQETVERLRVRLTNVDADILVGGQAATILDQNVTMNRDLMVIVPIIIAVVILVLGILLRAVVAPLLLLGCALLSAGAALGLSSVLFHAAGYPRTDQSVLILGFLFLVALGVDYTIFLMARAREEVGQRGHGPGLLHALAATGGVITSAGVVLAATFLVLTITPVVLNIQLGLLVAVGVLIDAFIVRTVLVPALAIDVGRRTWWPSHPDRATDHRSGIDIPD